MPDVVIVSAVAPRSAGWAERSKTCSLRTWRRSSSRLRWSAPGVEPAEVDEVVLGQTKQSADAANLARVAALKAGFPASVPAYTVMRQCGSGLQAVGNALQAIRAGDAEIVVAGGAESMSLAPYYLRGARFGLRLGNSVLVDPNTESQPRSQPRDVYGDLTMGLTAENLVERYGITREAQDAFALRSQERAFAAIEAGRFADEIVPVEVPARRGPATVFAVDEYPRHTSLEQLAALQPFFEDGGSVSPGNSSGRNDGAACLVLMSAAAAQARGIAPLATVRAHAVAGVDPRSWASARPRHAQGARAAAGLTIADLDLVELNEAFAARPWPASASSASTPARVNVDGGAIALGHPWGRAGGRLITTLVHGLRRRAVDTAWPDVHRGRAGYRHDRSRPPGDRRLT